MILFLLVRLIIFISVYSFSVIPLTTVLVTSSFIKSEVSQCLWGIITFCEFFQFTMNRRDRAADPLPNPIPPVPIIPPVHVHMDRVRERDPPPNL